MGVDRAIDLVDPDTAPLDTSISPGTSSSACVFAPRWSPVRARLAIASDYANMLRSGVSAYEAAAGDGSPALGNGAPIHGPGTLASSHDGTRLTVVDCEGNLALANLHTSHP